MKKLYIIIIIILVFLFYGCSNTTLNTDDLELSTLEVSCENIEAYIKEDEIKTLKESIVLVLKNNTEFEYFYGVNFTLEFQLNNVWYTIPFDKEIGFIEIGLILESNQTNESTIELSNYFTSLPKGKYRIVKTFYLDGEKLFIAAPFEINE